jgi:hypothetical protein
MSKILQMGGDCASSDWQLVFQPNCIVEMKLWITQVEQSVQLWIRWQPSKNGSMKFE